jgi:hypothetical protein
MSSTGEPSEVPGRRLARRVIAVVDVSPKTGATALGGALATIFWITAASTFLKGTLTDAAVAALTGASATVLAFILSYLIKDPLRRDHQ